MLYKCQITQIFLSGYKTFNYETIKRLSIFDFIRCCAQSEVTSHKRQLVSQLRGLISQSQNKKLTYDLPSDPRVVEAVGLRGVVDRLLVASEQVVEVEDRRVHQDHPQRQHQEDSVSDHSQERTDKTCNNMSSSTDGLEFIQPQYT